MPDEHYRRVDEREFEILQEKDSTIGINYDDDQMSVADAFADYLRDQGYTVECVECDDSEDTLYCITPPKRRELG
jgi:hypothetical protein